MSEIFFTFGLWIVNVVFAFVEVAPSTICKIKTFQTEIRSVRYQMPF